MIAVAFFLVISSHVTHGQQGNYNFFMPDVPPPPSRSSALLSSAGSLLTHQTHPFTTRTFSKINLSGGPFNVKLYRNLNSEENYTSVDVEAEEAVHSLITIDVDQNDQLTVRMIDNPNVVNKTNVTILITYGQLNELYTDGTVNIQCINQIETDTFRVHSRGSGTIKLKLNVNFFDAYLHSVGRIKVCGQVNEEATLKSLGVGDVDCRRLYTKKTNVISSGIGNIYVMASDEIYITLSGIGTVYYSGPLKQEIKTGLGNIMEMQEASMSDSQ
jgi:Putative auto-transporter adhesin, head GIN domain